MNPESTTPRQAVFANPAHEQEQVEQHPVHRPSPAMHIEGPHTPEEAASFRAALERNATLLQVLGRAATMNLPDWYLAAGSLTQSVWNMVTGHPPEYGIDDYDIVCKCLSFFFKSFFASSGHV